MANISTAMILIPIAISIAEQLGMNVFPLVIGIIWAADLPFSTPIGASPITMTMTAGYRFTDYTKVGGPFNVIAYILVIILTPIFYPLT
jgi:di/tricarboxylate transporter